jgi:hypothetical protein
MFRVGQNCICTPYMTVISSLKLPCIHRIYVYNTYVWFWPTLPMLPLAGVVFCRCVAHFCLWDIPSIALIVSARFVKSVGAVFHPFGSSSKVVVASWL